MRRNVLAWLLIVVGLVPLIGGCGLLAANWMHDRAVIEERLAKSRAHPNHPTAKAPYRNPDAFVDYGAPATMIVAGVALLFVGIKLRWPPKDVADGHG